MGASGAGKSTLLDVLSANTGSSAGFQVQGVVLVDGSPRNDAVFRTTSSFVQQQDVLLCSATVREAITTSALLKLPFNMPVALKLEKVESVITELGLESCADTLIGDETIGMKGISGGQKRRVAVGIELIKDPSVIFLDEPTSGLDSEMALSCMEVLRELAGRGRTVCCTIHQPNSDITALFDDFILLAAGRVVFAGPWAHAVEYFIGLGFVCPSYRNPTDYFMSVVRDPKQAEQLWTAHERGIQCPDMARDFNSSKTHGLATPQAATPDLESNQPTNQQGTGDRHLASSNIASGPLLQSMPVPMWYQTWIIMQRNWKNWLRNPNMLMSELVQYIFIAVFVGAMYCNSFTSDIPDGVSNRVACIWFCLAVLTFTPSYTAVTAWDKERLLLRRELSQRQFGVTVWYIARTLMLVPFQGVQVLLFVSVMYFFAGFQRDFAKFAAFFFTLWMFQLISEGVGLLCAIGTRTATYAIITLTFVLLILLSFTGFLVTKIPVYFKWITHISFLTYAYFGMVANEFEGLTLYDANGAAVQGLDLIPSSQHNSLSVWGNVGIVCAIVMIMEGLKLGALQAAYRFRRM